MNIAIIGSGISGLTAAFGLHPDHDITVFEAGSYVGGHANTVDVELAGERYAIDTGFIVFNDWTYPNFVKMLTELGVASRPTSMSFSVHDERTGLEYNGQSLASLFAQRRNLFRPAFYRMLADILRFHREAPRLAASCGDDATVGEFLDRHGFSRSFAEQYLLPMGAAIWSCPTGTFSQFPIRFIVEFYQHHGLLSLWRKPTWRVVESGSRSYVRALTHGFRDRIRLRTPVTRVQRRFDGVFVTSEGREPQRFDHVVFACHSDQALAILGDDATTTERELLAEFPYQPNIAVLHTDVTVLPQRRRVWASWNYRVGERASESTPAIVTYNMNLLQGIHAPHTFCVTLNDESRIDPRLILGRFDYHHPIFTTKRAAAQARHAELLNVNRTSYCGAYWGDGFHEAGVNSGHAVVDAIRNLRRSSESVDPRDVILAGVAP